MFELFKNNFDKFLISFFTLYFTFLGWHAVFYLSHHDGVMMNNPLVQNFMSAMLDNQKLVIGALLGLITGRAMASQSKNGGSNGTTTQPTGGGSTPPTTPPVA
jgi:hypothetical protein